ncbi:lactate racemase domain-containing protein [Tundrisphaera lichenicola]|uniref:lactate racemase domain-containing protein n=1 Tax=Tundrisphaera lichenicola TaxID=2029860 RepID=UPI003EBE4514
MAIVRASGSLSVLAKVGASASTRTDSTESAPPMNRPSTEPSPSIALPWGEGPPLPLEIPRTWDLADVSWPDLSGALDDYPTALSRALDEPEGGQGIASAAGSTVAIVVDDPSRWTPIREALPIVLGRLRDAGIRPGDISISVGVGRHHAVDAASMRQRVGDGVVDAHRCFSPPVDELSEYDDLGTTDEGIPVRVFRTVARAGLRILIGSVLPHLQAGFGGGYKLIFPGTSHRSTLGAIHRMGLGGDAAGKLLGSDASENPMRRAIRSAAARLGPCVSISHLMGPPGTVLHVASGHPDPVQDRLAFEARRRFRAGEVDPRLVDVVVAGNSPWPGDPMMSFKVLLQHRAASRPGGVLIGFFRTDPAEIDRSFPMPAMRGIAASGAAGGWVIRRGLAAADRVMSALHAPSEFMIRWARELVVDRTVLVYAPPLFDRIGPRLGPIRLFADQARLWEAAREALPGIDRPRCRVFPQGGLTYCPEW